MITTFIFDVGGTLIEVDDDNYGPLLTSRFLSENLPKLECSGISIDDFIKGIQKETLLPIPDIIDYFMKPLTGKYIDEMRNVINWTFRNHHTILLSNTNALHWSYFSQYIYDYHAKVLSFDVGSRKPNKSIYNLADNLAKSNNIIYFDDKEENLKYPTTLGWSCYKFKSAKHCWKIIEQL